MPASIALKWEKNFLHLNRADMPAPVKINYLEAFCRSGSTNQDWHLTMIPHSTKLIRQTSDRVELQSEVAGGVRVDHTITSTADEVTFRLTLVNTSDKFVDAQWAQPCIRVGDFMGMAQDNFMKRAFIEVAGQIKSLDQTRRTNKALYTPGQVYVPADVNRADVNPRPLSPDVPSRNLIGCYSKDDKLIFATAWSQTQELFEGVAVCIHSDFRIGGMKPGETKELLGKIYIIPNQMTELLRRYERDFPARRQSSAIG